MKKQEIEHPTVTRGFLTKAYPTIEQDQAMYAMQDSLRCAWNWICDLWDGHCRREEQWAIAQGLVAPIPPKPEYSGLSSEEAHAAKLERKRFLRDRRKEIIKGCKADSSSPQYVPLMAAPGKPSVAARCSSLGLTPAKTQDYQILNLVLRDRGLPELSAYYLQSLVKSHKASLSSKQHPKKRKQCDIMPIKVRSGGDVRMHPSGPHNASIKLPGVPGRIAVRIDKRTVSKMMTPGSRWIEGATLTFEHGTWWCSLLVSRPVYARESYGLRSASEKAKPQPVLLDSDQGPGTGVALGIDPGLSDLVTDSSGVKVHNRRNLLFATHRDDKLSELRLASNLTGVDNSAEVRAVYRSDARMRRRVTEQLRQYAAKIDRECDVVFVERNSGIALGIGQSAYVGATKKLVGLLRMKMGWDRVREVESFYNSQDCSQCGYRDKKTWERKLGQKDQTCQCTQCSCNLDRDVNAARNVLAKGVESLMSQAA